MCNMKLSDSTCADPPPSTKKVHTLKKKHAQTFQAQDKTQLSINQMENKLKSFKRFLCSNEEPVTVKDLQVGPINPMSKRVTSNTHLTPFCHSYFKGVDWHTTFHTQGTLCNDACTLSIKRVGTPSTISPLQSAWHKVLFSPLKSQTGGTSLQCDSDATRHLTIWVPQLYPMGFRHCYSCVHLLQNKEILWQ